MQLPKQNLPIFELVIPSNGKRISYRQLTVREEKMMLQAQEVDDPRIIINCTREIIKNCVSPESKLDIDNLAIFDIELLITRIRAKSMGEKIELLMPCEKHKDHEAIKYTLDLEKIEVVKKPEHTTKIHLFDNVGIVMRYPRIDDLAADTFTKLDLVKMCIDMIYDDENVFQRKDIEEKEIDDFVESLTEDQIKKIYTAFFETMPSFEHTLEYTCPKCEASFTKTIKGLSSFFV